MVSVNNLTRRPTPSLPYEEIAATVLGRRYDLSLVLIGSRRSRRLNRQYRQKDYPADVLAFPLAKSNGEIFIDLGRAEKTCQQFNHSYLQQVAFLVIHASLHLKGYEHGSTMEAKEQKLIKTLNLASNPSHEPAHRHRSGYRDSHHSRGRLRIQKRQ
ncbi:MAG: rRNA maturation RNase YbeY [Candidatus Paceibacterota bacterium]